MTICVFREMMTILVCRRLLVMVVTIRVVMKVGVMVVIVPCASRGGGVATEDEMLIGGASPAVPDADDVAELRDDLEILRLEVEMDLVPDWSNALQRMCAHYGEAVSVGVAGDKFVVKTAVAPEKKPELMATIQRYWAEFARRRKLEDRW